MAHKLIIRIRWPDKHQNTRNILNAIQQSCAGRSASMLFAQSQHADEM